MNNALRVYVAGKISKDSIFGTHDWRDAFLTELMKLSGRQLINLDPTKTRVDQANPDAAFGANVYMISVADVVVVYLSDDISIGGSQEILIAKYFKKPVLGLAPLGGKFNGSTKEYYGEVVENYRDPFVFSTCDEVCSNIEALGQALKKLEQITPKDINLLGQSLRNFEKNYRANNEYLKKLIA